MIDTDKYRYDYTLPPGLLLVPDFPPMLGGISSYLFNIYSNIDLSSLILVASKEPGSEEFDANQTYLPKRFTLPNLPPGFRWFGHMVKSYCEAQKIIKEKNGLVVHCGHINAAILAYKLKKKYGTPYLVWTYASEIMDRLLYRNIKEALLNADLVITISDFTQKYIESFGVAPSKIIKIRPGTSPSYFNQEINKSQLESSLGIGGKRVLLTIGRFSRREQHKGQDMVIRAMPKILKAIPNLVYVLAGAGDDKGYYRQLAKKNGVQEHVKFIGKVADQDLPPLYNCCDVFIMCSREKREIRRNIVEGFGIVFLEASSAAKPVIGGNSGGVSEAVKDGFTGILVDPANISDIADAVVSLMTDSVLAQQYGRNGRAWVEKEMNWKRASKEFQEAYARCFPIPVII